MSDDLFAPVTQHELDALHDAKDNHIFSPLSADEKALLETIEAGDTKPGRLEAVARGATQGITADFGDEIAGKWGALSPSVRPEARAIDQGVIDTSILQEKTRASAKDKLADIGGLIKEMEAQGFSKGDIVKQVAFLKGQADKEYASGFDVKDHLYRDRERRRNAAADEAHPWLFGGAKLGGGIAAGGPGAKIAMGAGRGVLAATLAAEGAVQGLGESEKESAGGQAWDTTKGALFGLGGGAVAYGGGTVVKALAETKPVQALAKGTAKVMADLPFEFSQKLLKNPDLKAPKTFETISDEVVGSANKLKQEIGEADEKAWETLSHEPKYRPQDLKNEVKQSVLSSQVGEVVPARVKNVAEIGRETATEAVPSRGTVVLKTKPDELPVKTDDYIPIGGKVRERGPDQIVGMDEVGAASQKVTKDTRGAIVPEFEPEALRSSAMGQQKQAFKKAKEVMDELDSHSGPLSEVDLRRLRKKVDDEINWDKEEYEAANNLLMTIRGKLDARLKTNRAYEAAIAPVHEKITQLDDLKKAFRLTKDGQGGLVATDTTLSKLKTLSDDLGKKQHLKPNTQSSLEQVAPRSVEDLDTNRVFRTLEADTTRGSRTTTPFTIIGGTIGAAVGGAPGAAIGGAAGNVTGRAYDKFARAVAGYGLRKGSKVIGAADKKINDVAGSIMQRWNNLKPKHQQLLTEAAQRGGRSLSVSHFLLSQQDPAYNAAFEENQSSSH